MKLHQWQGFDFIGKNEAMMNKMYSSTKYAVWYSSEGNGIKL